jgi:single-strand DNA-binding protein
MSPVQSIHDGAATSAAVATLQLAGWRFSALDRAVVPLARMRLGRNPVQRPPSSQGGLVNSVSLTGTVATDPELDSLGDGRRLCSFRLVVVRPWGAGACFIRIVASGRQANGCARVVRAGQRIAVDGRLRSRTWDAGGERRTSVEVVAESVSLLSAAEAVAA